MQDSLIDLMVPEEYMEYAPLSLDVFRQMWSSLNPELWVAALENRIYFPLEFCENYQSKKGYYYSRLINDKLSTLEEDELILTKKSENSALQIKFEFISLLLGFPTLDSDIKHWLCYHFASTIFSYPFNRIETILVLFASNNLSSLNKGKLLLHPNMPLTVISSLLMSKKHIDFFENSLFSSDKEGWEDIRSLLENTYNDYLYNLGWDSETLMVTSLKTKMSIV